MKPNDVYGRFTIIREAGVNPIRYECKCTCGTVKTVRAHHLRSGKILSCGCYKSEQASFRAHNMHNANLTHGLSRSRAYQCWLGMKQRCLNPNSKYYAYYGGRGIRIEWDSFESFYADMGDPPENMSIDRIDVNGNYAKDNCRWASRKTQASNTRACVFLTVNNITKTIADWSRETGVHRNTITKRMVNGMTPEECISNEKFTSNKFTNATHCIHGHEFTRENTSYFKNGSRRCKTCHRERARVARSSKGR